MYCKRCGSKLEENMLGCPVCGQPVEEELDTDFKETDDFQSEEPKKQTQELYLQAANMQIGNVDQTQKILRINDPRQQTLLGAHRGLFFTFIALVLIAILAVSAALYIYKDLVEQESIPHYTITYETNGGSRIPSQEVKEGTVVSAPPEPTISGRYFAGWYSDTSCQKQVKFPLTANENMTLYAKWMRDQKAAEQALNSNTTDNTEQENSSNTTSSNNATN